MKYLLFSISTIVLLTTISCGDEPVLDFEDQLEKDLAAIDRYLDKNNIDAIEHESGIRYVVTAEGDGERPIQSSTVTVKYTGRFFDGKKFDESKTGATFGLPNLILAWRIMIPEMEEGGSITIYAPSGFCYGTSGNSNIDPNKNLIFEMELIRVQ